MGGVKVTKWMVLVCPTLVVYASLAVELSVLSAAKLHRPAGCLSQRAGKCDLGFRHLVLQCRLMQDARLTQLSYHLRVSAAVFKLSFVGAN